MDNKKPKDLTPNFVNELGGEVWRILRFADDKDNRWSAFNPSIAYSPVEGYVVLIRSSNYFLDAKTTHAVPTIGNRVMTRMWLATLSDDWKIIEDSLREIDFSNAGIVFLRGAEDGRLVWRDGSWEFTATMKEPSVPMPRIGRFRLDGLKATLLELFDDEGLQDMEKNWMPSVASNKKFDYIYGPNSVYIKGQGVVERRPMIDAIKDVRGGSQLWWFDNWGYLSIIHEAVTTPTEIYVPRFFGFREVPVRKYYHRFARYSEDGTLIGLSDRFRFDDVRIEFAAGLVVDEDEVIISYGFKDVVSKLARIKLKTVLGMIKDV